MAGVVPTSASFSFNGLSAAVTDVSVETPKAGIIDMTSIHDPASRTVMVPTKEVSGGSVTVGFLQQSGQLDPQGLIGTIGQLSFFGGGYGVSRRAILESATTEARVGELVRGTLRFRMTDYYGS